MKEDNMKQGWEYTTFADVMKPAKTERCGNRTDLPVLSITMRQGIIFQSNRFKKAIASTDTKDYKIIKEGQLVIAFPIDEGLIYTQDIVKEGIMSPAYNVWDVDYSKLNNKFLNLFFHSPWAMKYYKSKLRGTTLRRRMIPKEDLLALPIPVPPLSVQEQIVSELDLLSGIIEKKREQLKELDALAQSIFYDMFGDPEQSSYNIIPLSKLSNNKLSYGSGASAIPFNGEIRYIRITDIKEDGKLNTEAVSPSIMEEKYILNEGDILFARSGATVGKTYLYKESDGKAIYAGYLIRFIPNKEQVLPTYIYYYTKTDYYKAFISKSAQAVAQPNINAQQYGLFMVPVPPIPLQHQFATKIEAIERQKELIKQSISETETLFNARMQEHFG